MVALAYIQNILIPLSVVPVLSRKASDNLGQQWSKGIPVEVIPSAYRSVYQRIEKVLGGKSELRMSGASKAVRFLKTLKPSFFIITAVVLFRVQLSLTTGILSLTGTSKVLKTGEK